MAPLTLSKFWPEAPYIVSYGVLSVELGIHLDLRWPWKLFVKRHRQLATTFNHRKSHWNTRRTPTDCLIASFRSMPYMAYIAHVVTGVWCSIVSICDARVCTALCLAGQVSLATRNQSTKDIDPYFKSQLYVEDPGTECRYSVYRMGWVNPESARTTDIFISAVGGIRTHNLLVDSPTWYHWAITDRSLMCLSVWN